MNILSIIAATLIGLSSQARADAIEDAGPQFIAGGQYTATLEQTSGRWQLLPLDAQDQEVANDCRQQVYLPKGVWLLNRDRLGQLELVATSGTALPPGHSERVKLLPCEAAGSQPSALRAPSTLISWLAEHTGAVLVGE